MAKGGGEKRQNTKNEAAVEKNRGFFGSREKSSTGELMKIGPFSEKGNA